jgi:hypothetical protein
LGEVTVEEVSFRAVSFRGVSFEAVSQCHEIKTGALRKKYGMAKWSEFLILNLI